MKVSVKTLQNKKYEIEVELDQSVLQIKQKIHGDLKLGEVGMQKLIHHGKILKDDQLVSKIGIKEGDFIVIMLTKQKKKKPAPAPVAAAPVVQPQSAGPAAVAASPSPAAAPAPTESPPAAAASSAAMDTSPPAVAAAASASQPAAVAASQPAAADPGAFQSSASALVTGPEYQNMVASLMGLGFDHDQVTAALRASFNNPDRAAEYLFSGIPENLQQAAAQQPNPSAAADSGADQASPESAAQAAGGGAQAGPGSAAGISPAQLGMMLQQNPQLIQGLLQQIGQQNPELLEQMGNNPEAVMKLLQDPQILARLLGGMGGGGGGGMGGPPPGTITVTEEEKEAIERLESLGFDKRRAIEAYLACDKNEQLAANYLFDNAADMMEDVQEENTDASGDAGAQS